MIDAVSKASVELVQLVGRVRRVQLRRVQHNRFMTWSCAQLVQTGSNRSSMDIVFVVTLASLQDRNVAIPGPVSTEHELDLAHLRFTSLGVRVRRRCRSDVLLLALAWPGWRASLHGFSQVDFSTNGVLSIRSQYE